MKTYILLLLSLGLFSFAGHASVKSCSEAMTTVNMLEAGHGDFSQLRKSMKTAIDQCQSEIDGRDSILYSSLLSRCYRINKQDVAIDKGQVADDDVDSSQELCSFHAMTYILDLHPKIYHMLEMVPRK